LLESLARELALRIRSRGDNESVHVEGRGVHWHVDAHGSKGGPWCRVHCFHYGGMEGSLVLGPKGNAHLSKVDLGIALPARSGAEYLVEFRAGDRTLATGRSQEADAVVMAVVDWVTHQLDRAALYERHSFVDAKRRALLDVADGINQELHRIGAAPRAVLDGEDADEFGELWVYAGDRSCRLSNGYDSAIACALLLKRAQLGRANGLSASEAARVVQMWSAGLTSLGAIREAVPAIQLDHACELFERGDHAGWHWANVLAQCGVDTSLAKYRPLLERIASNPVVSRFFSFTSVGRLCLSRSSLYPFDASGLPIVVPRPRQDGWYATEISGKLFVEATAEATCAALEDHLARETVSPYWGTVEEVMAERLNQELRGRRSPLRAECVQRRQWLDVIVSDGAGRTCKLHGGRDGELTGTFGSDPSRERRTFSTVQLAADALTDWAQEVV
jgi:hypothetical protein